MDRPSPTDNLVMRRLGASTGRRGLHNSVAHKLGCMIIGGQLQPGEKLPNDDQFSALLSVSRTAYREGIRTLSAKGLVETRAKVGTKVAPRGAWSMLDPEVLAWHLEVEPSRHFIDSLFEVRQIFEPAAAAITAQRRSDADLEAIQASYDEMERATPGSHAALKADIDFHRELLRATHNEPLIAMTPVIESTMRWSVRLTLDAFPRGHGGSLPDHRAVLEAVKAGQETEARTHMSELVITARANLLRSLGKLKA